MSDHERETAFLRRCLVYDDTGERHKLEESITQLQRNERCVRRAVWLMVLLAALGMAGLSYSAVFLADYPKNMSRFTAQFIPKVFCALGLGSMISLLAFVGLGVVHRNKLDQRREECRRLAMRLLESRLGKPRIMTQPAVGKEREGIELVVSSPDRELAHGTAGVSLAHAGRWRWRGENELEEIVSANK
jgi:hypothetical protein